MLDGIWSFSGSFGSIDDFSDDFFLFYFAPGFSMQWSVYAIIFSFLSAAPSKKHHIFVSCFIPLLTAKQPFRLIGKYGRNWEDKVIKHSDEVATCPGTFAQCMQITEWEKCFIIDISSKLIEPTSEPVRNWQESAEIEIDTFFPLFLHRCLFHIFLPSSCHVYIVYSKTPKVLLYFTNNRNLQRSFNAKGVTETF